jgi:hypothetical protein
VPELFGNCLKCKKWKKYIILPVQETYLKSKCLLFYSIGLINNVVVRESLMA